MGVDVVGVGVARVRGVAHGGAVWGACGRRPCDAGRDHKQKKEKGADLSLKRGVRDQRRAIDLPRALQTLR